MSDTETTELHLCLTVCHCKIILPLGSCWTYLCGFLAYFYYIIFWRCLHGENKSDQCWGQQLTPQDGLTASHLFAFLATLCRDGQFTAAQPHPAFWFPRYSCKQIIHQRISSLPRGFLSVAFNYHTLWHWFIYCYCELWKQIHIYLFWDFHIQTRAVITPWRWFYGEAEWASSLPAVSSAVTRLKTKVFTVVTVCASHAVYSDLCRVNFTISTCPGWVESPLPHLSSHHRARVRTHLQDQLKSKSMNVAGNQWTSVMDDVSLWEDWRKVFLIPSVHPSSSADVCQGHRWAEACPS